MTLKLSFPREEARKYLCYVSLQWDSAFQNTQIGMYSMPKLHKHLFKMEFSLATLRSLNFIPSLKNMV